MDNSSILLKQIFGRYKPGFGAVTVEKSRQKRTDDILLAKYFVKKFGGNYTIISDIAPHGVKPPDIILHNRAIFESKNVSSLTSADSQTKKALLQLDKNNLNNLFPRLNNRLKRVLIINLEDSFPASLDAVEQVILHRIARYSTENVSYIDYVIVKGARSGLYCFNTPKNPHK